MNLNSMAEDPELAHALALSMKDGTNGNTNSNSNTNSHSNSVQVMEVDDEAALLQQALAMSMQNETDQNENTGDHNNNKSQKQSEIEIEDKEKKEEVVIAEEPDAEEKDCCLIQLRFANNKAIKRRFRRTDLLEDVAHFAKSVDASLKNVVFVCPPNASYHELGISLDAVCTELGSKMLSFRVKENQNPNANADVDAKKEEVVAQ